jgi:hypothetical protein
MKAMTWLAVALTATVTGCGQDLFGSPCSATAFDNRRVVVVIEEPA